MDLFIFFLVVSFIIFLFCLYKIGRDDIVLIRKNVPLEQLFNIAFLSVGIGVLGSRLFYVLENPARGFLNPLVFLLFPYFPGLSLVGGVTGALLAVVYFSRRKKLPTTRILDFFALAFFAAVPIGFLGSIFLSGRITFLETVFLPLLYLILFIILLKIFFPKLIQNSLQQGSIAALALVLFSLVSFLTSMVQNKSGIIFFIDVSEIVAIILFAISLGFLIKQEATQ